MKLYKDLTTEQQGLFDKLIDAIINGQDTKSILESDGIQDVLSRWNINVGDGNDTKIYCTLLTYAIACDNIEAAKNILDTADRNTLKILLEKKSTIQYKDGKEKFYTALGFAEERKKHFEDYHTLIEKDGQLMQEYQSLIEKDGQLMREYQPSIEESGRLIQEYQSLVVKIKGKMQELTAANDLFWAVLKGDNKYADSLLTKYKKDTQVILQIDWMVALFIGYEKARALAAEDNETIIKKIQTRQAVGIGIVGGLLLAGAIAAFVFAPIIIGIITAVAGFAVAGFAAHHGLKPVPDTKMDEVDNAEHTGPEQTV